MANRFKKTAKKGGQKKMLKSKKKEVKKPIVPEEVESNEIKVSTVVMGENGESVGEATVGGE